MRFHFAIGPVQTFVGQARRTRDLWAGSFLLSYLAFQAIKAVSANQGTIIFPARGREHTGLEMASTPNRFVAEVGETFQPKVCVDAVLQAWERLADAVWIRFIASVASQGNHTQAIWKRQVDGFWDISWALGDDWDLLDRRKHLKSYVPSSESGVKCVMIPQLQEISGHGRADDRNRFWRAVNSNLEGLDLQEDEALSAVAFVKRLFPRLRHADLKILGMELSDDQIHYPSTVALSARPWCEQQLAEDPPWRNELKRYLTSLDAAERKKIQTGDRLDPALFYDGSRTNDRLWPEGTAEMRDRVGQIMGAVQSRPEPYYALLLMDGDHLGHLLRHEDPSAVSAALAHFTQKVPTVVESHDGTLVYAGGDDVLALFAKPRALGAAWDLRHTYEEAMGEFKTSTSLSGAIVYAHMHAPLTAVVAEAHHLLDTEAKEHSGRDALAFDRFSSAGHRWPFAAKWKDVRPEKAIGLPELVDRVSSLVSSRWLFKIQELESRLGSAQWMTNQEWRCLLENELKRTRTEEGKGAPSSDEIEDLLEALRRLAEGGRRVGAQPETALPWTRALRLLHFLAQDEEDRE